MTTVERWNGTPQVLPPVWLFSMNALWKLPSHALSSAVLTKVSIGTMASSSISVNMSVDSSTDVTGGEPVDGLGDRAADRGRIEERDLGGLRLGGAPSQRGEGGAGHEDAVEGLA